MILNLCRPYRNLPVLVVIVTLFGAILSGRTTRAADRPEATTAQQILAATGLSGGLIVHLGCDAGKLTTALCANDCYVVQGLDTDPEVVRGAREYVQRHGLYGRVSIERFDGRRLPYTANMVNLIVVEDRYDVPRPELMRVLSPGGILYWRQDGVWTKTVKPHPGNTDQWTHYLYDASGNPVAHDEVVSPPKSIQWLADPRFTRSHEHTPSINSVVSAGGRLFYIADEGSISSIRKPGRWKLVARDAYNGLLLWKRPITSWFPVIINWGVAPSQLQRKLVAVNDRVYVTLGLHAPLSEVDAKSGKTLRTYEDTGGTEEILLYKGVLLLATRQVTKERVAELVEWARLAKENNSPLFQRGTAEPLINRLRSIERRAEKAIVAVDAKTGRRLWKKSGKEARGLKALSLCAGGNRVFFQNGKSAVCLDLKTGRQVWQVDSLPLHLVHDRVVVCANAKRVAVRSADDGSLIWSEDSLLTGLRDVFVIKNSVWLGGFRPCPEKRSAAWGPYFAIRRDLRTGKLLMQVEPENPGHHHRCYLNKATDRYILGGRRGTEFIDVASGDVRWNTWIRGVCKYGVLPSNGLFYSPSNECGCYVATKLAGFYALSGARESGPETALEVKQRLEKGPAFDAGPIPISTASAGQDWPTYRHDSQRSGRTGVTISGKLHIQWTCRVGRRLGSLSVADGMVFVPSIDEHAVNAIDCDSGKRRWQFVAGARVDSPPTIYQHRVLFGSHDGAVYSLRASDGLLAWRLNVARNPDQIIARGQLEAASPVPGNVLIQNGVAFVAAGRSSYLDGGIDLYRLQPRMGEILSKSRIFSPDPKTGKQPEPIDRSVMPGERWDLLTGDSKYVYLRDMVFDHQAKQQPKGEPHLLALTGFLDDSWVHRSYWIFGKQCSLSTGCSGRARHLVFGRLLVFDKETVYGFGRKKVDWSSAFQDGPYRLFATLPDGKQIRWTKSVPIQVRAMILAGDTLLVAGPRVDEHGDPLSDDRPDSVMLMAVSAANGDVLAKVPLNGCPIFDGMAAAEGQLYLALEDGHVICLGP